MDLSHWDSVALLLPEETAKLMAGVDPLGTLAPKTATAKILLFYRLICEAHTNAFTKALTFAGVEPNPPNVIAPDVFEPWLNELVSLELRNSFSNLLAAPLDVGLMTALKPGNLDEVHLNRDDIHDWIVSQGIKSIYRFDGIGNESLPDINEEAETTTSKTQTASDESDKRTAETSSANPNYKSDMLNILNQAAFRFWANADPSNKARRTDNKDVVAWLIERGFSEGTAKKGATIIRPDWAGTGRKPKEA